MSVAETSARSNPVLRPHLNGGPQHLLITLLGDYWFGREELLPSAALVDLLAEFGTTENAARQSMRRLTQRGALVQGKRGRTTLYGIPPEVVASQRLRLARAVTFGADFRDWDGTWTVVAFSIPESERDVRRLLRNRLRSMAFGDLQDGLWITPHDRRDDAMELLDELGIVAGRVMTASWELRPADQTAIVDAFDLGALGEQYDAFRERCVAASEAAAEASPAEALRIRTRLTNDWLAFRLKDPELPATLLPESWPRPGAREAFLAAYDALGPAAAEHVRSVIARYDPALSHIVTHHAAPKVNQHVTPEMSKAVADDRRRDLA